MRALRLLILLMLCCGASQAQELPDLSSAHRFWDKPNQVLVLTHVALESADFAITHRNLSRGGRELNPMGKALCESGTAGQVTFFAARAAAVGTMAYLFHKTRHHRLERAFLIFANADSAFGVTYSFAHR
ncbi:MAG TPA: hypothetical protein VFA68_06430 [Terriglobales bacterium]|nr:hypothetical protein [Terriglobales bacterium]